MKVENLIDPSQNLLNICPYIIEPVLLKSNSSDVKWPHASSNISITNNLTITSNLKPGFLLKFNFIITQFFVKERQP